jgi:anti-sigma B factor antagonist
MTPRVSDSSAMSIQPDPSNRPDLSEASLTCQVIPGSDAVRVRAAGSLDVATTPVLEQQLQELVDAGHRHLVVDLGGLSFMDSTGLRLALRWDAAGRKDGFQVRFMRGSPAVQRVFEVTGMADRVPFLDP